MERWKDRVALVTGASAAIGLAVAKTLAKHGMQVIICGRNFEKLKEAATELNKYGSGSVYGCDVTKEDEILAMFEKINDKYGGVDVMINAAVLAIGATLTTGRTEDWRSMLDMAQLIFATSEVSDSSSSWGRLVNVLGTCSCSREAVNSMKKYDVDDGHIININGLSGHQVERDGSKHFLAVTKFALTAVTEGLRHELRDMKSHIKVTQISAGRVHNEFHGGQSTANKNPYTSLDGQDVADVVVSILSTPPHVQIQDILMRPIEQVQ